MSPLTIADVLLRTQSTLSGNDIRPVDANRIFRSKLVQCNRIANDLWYESGKTSKDGGLPATILRFDKSTPARMPFDELWIEWAVEPDAHDGVLGKPGPNEPGRMANCAVQMWAIPDLADVPADMRRKAPAAARHAIGFELYAKRVIGYDFVQHIVGGVVFLDEDHRHLPDATAIRFPPGLEQTDRAVWVMNVACRYWLAPALYAVALMNCRNITVLPDTTEVRRSKKSKPEKIPRLAFHTIRLPQQSYAAGSSHGDSDPTARAHHLVRGHFKTYTPEAPLLGKAVGTYWWGWQARGSKKNGLVISDYEVA